MEPNSSDRRFPRVADPRRQAIARLAEEIHTLKSRGREYEALEAEHAAIQLALESLWEAILASAGRPEVLEILNASVDFCLTHFADEELFMRSSGRTDLAAHIAAHERLLENIVAARRRASGEGLSLAVLDAADLLHEFHEHVRTYDQAAYGAARALALSAAFGATDPAI